MNFWYPIPNRSAALNFVDNKKTISDNGIFRPILVVDGQVKGLWKRTTKKDRVLIETDHFQLHYKETITFIENELIRYGKFLNKRVEITDQFLPQK